MGSKMTQTSLFTDVCQFKLGASEPYKSKLQKRKDYMKKFRQLRESLKTECKLSNDEVTQVLLFHLQSSPELSMQSLSFITWLELSNQSGKCLVGRRASV